MPVNWDPNPSRPSLDDSKMASLQTAVRSTKKIAPNVLRRQPISDVAITRTGKPILRSQGGRCV